MTDTLTSPRISPRTTSRSAPSAPSAAVRATLTAGVAAGPLFLAAGLVQGAARDGFDFTRNALSQLALGEDGWIQTVNFAVAGALLLAGAGGLRRTLRGRPGGTWGPALVAVFAVSFWLAAAFPADTGAGFPAGAAEETVMTGHGTVHMAAGTVGYLALCAAFLVLARPLAAAGHRGWARASRIVPVVVLAGFMASATAVLAFTCGAGLGMLWLSAITTRLTTGSTTTH
ncbi:DUF998 domain-containing protein [Streptomyces sp. NPDC057682]|uniref:DUF998 domain-containing protein n=1 Tax=Streptomyces sp. NPDC057682 TaxID=3346210 RepID=UPI0036C95CA4